MKKNSNIRIQTTKGFTSKPIEKAEDVSLTNTTFVERDYSGELPNFTANSWQSSSKMVIAGAREDREKI